MITGAAAEVEKKEDEKDGGEGARHDTGLEVIKPTAVSLPLSLICLSLWTFFCTYAGII